MDNVTAAYVNAPGEPPNTMSRMQATIDATCAEIGAIASERLRAAWAEVVQLHEDTKAIKATYASSSVIWNARADALADYLDDIDTASDRAKGDDTAYRALVQQKIDQSHTIVRVDGGGQVGGVARGAGDLVHAVDQGQACAHAVRHPGARRLESGLGCVHADASSRAAASTASRILM